MEKQKLPGANSALILGIFSIVTACCCYGIPGVVLGFIGLNKAKKAQATYDENPEHYDGLGNVKAGKTTSMIGLIIGVVVCLWMIYIIATGKIGEQMDQYKELIEQMQNQ